MRSVNLLRLAIEAEILRLRHLLQRQGRRAAFGLFAAIFGVSVLVLANVVGWQVLRLYVAPIYATLILIGVSFVIAIVFALLASRSSPSHTEREALRIRREALEGVQSSLALTAALPVISGLIGAPRRRNGRRWPLGLVWRR
jgi:TRAP-type mannitol/chloroaromatic compound transport system permease large subunit